MTQQDYANNIRNQQVLIGQYNRKIEQLRQEIIKIQQTQKKITAIKEQFRQYQNQTLNRLSDNSEAMTVNQHIAQGISRKLTGAVNDIEHSSIIGNLGQSVTQGDREIQNRNNQIAALQSQISTCNANISSSNAAIAQLQAEAAAEAEE